TVNTDRMKPFYDRQQNNRSDSKLMIEKGDRTTKIAKTIHSNNQYSLISTVVRASSRNHQAPTRYGH
ncbi:unnamed protein product, partial [Rotaria magnacalcarata]